MRTRVFQVPGPAGLIARVVLGVLVASTAAAAHAPVASAAASRSAPGSPPARCVPATPTALAGFFDDALPRRLRADHVPGAAVSVVAGDRTAFARGYGMADAEHGVAFDPARSLVRIASITKLFTWTAVMQQVEAGRLDLDADVNRYLTAFKVPRTYPQPVTLRALMNHTAGFEDRIIGTGARTAADVPPLGTYLARHMPARIRPPSVISAYSNYGAALAGYIVSLVSGEPYDAYVRRHLLEPLGMAHTTATEPVPGPLATDLARSYDSDADPPRRVPFIFDPMMPDGSVSATAADMAHLMTAYLNGGRFGGRAILGPATMAEMFRRSYAADPRLAGWAHGFMDRTMNGHRVITHDGSWEGFESVLMMVPECHLGLFLTTNATGGVDAATDVIRTFFDRFVPDTAASGAAPAPAGSATSTEPAPAPASRLAVAAPKAGFYEPARHNESSIEKLLVLLGPLRLTVRGDGTVHFKGKDWAPGANGLYIRADGEDHLVFLTGRDGRRYVATDGPTYQVLAADQAPTVNLPVLLGFILVALGGLAVPAAALWRRVRRRPTGTTTTTWRLGRALAAGATTLGLGFLVLLAVRLFGDTSDFLYGVPGSFRALLVLPVVALVLGGAALACTVAGWRGSRAAVVARVHQAILLAGLAALAWFLWQWNLVG